MRYSHFVKRMGINPNPKPNINYPIDAIICLPDNLAEPLLYERAVEYSVKTNAVQSFRETDGYQPKPKTQY